MPPLRASGNRGRERRTGEAGQFLEQLALEPLVMDAAGRIDPALVMPVAAGGARLRVITGREPFLGEVPAVVGTGPPILVGTQPGSSASLVTSGHIRATAARAW